LPQGVPACGDISSPKPFVLPILSASISQIEELKEIMAGKKGLIVCGFDRFDEGFAKSVQALGQRLNAPVLADPLSNVRFAGEGIFSNYDAFLKNEEFCQSNRPDWVLRFGAQPVSKALGVYLSGLEDTAQILVDSDGSHQDPFGLADVIVNFHPSKLCDLLDVASGPTEWMQDFDIAEQTCEEIQLQTDLPLEADVVKAIADSLPALATLFSGNSTPIRHIDSFLSSGHAEFKIQCNRGLSGIEGNVSTVMGLAAASDHPVVGFMGDLTLTHDISALALGRNLNVTLVVINNDGGGIFEYLPQANLDEQTFEKYWLTPSAPDIKAASEAFGARHHQVCDIEDFCNVFGDALTNTGTDLIEVVVDRQKSTRAHKAFWQAVAQCSLSTGVLNPCQFSGKK